jgi:hypothetical protein
MLGVRITVSLMAASSENTLLDKFDLNVPSACVVLCCDGEKWMR